jgi:hypothetical protein
VADKSTRSLEERVKELEDVREIIDTFWHFHDGASGGWNGLQAARPEALDALSDDGTIEVQGRHKPGEGPTGREQLTQFWDYFYGDAGPLPYAFQGSFGDRVEVNGDEAIHYSHMLFVGAFRDREPNGDPGPAAGRPVLTLSKRRNWLRRTPEGWRITKTTMEGGFTAPLEKLDGPLNELPPAEKRTPWSFTGEIS